MDATKYVVRLAAAADVTFLPDVERRAGFLFKSHPEDLGIPEAMYEEPNSIDTFAAAQRAGRLWVAVTPQEEVVGFALVVIIDGYAHLEELDVLPSLGRQGIGSALLETVCRWVAQADYSGVSLRTFRDVPWNRPFYERRGFHVVDSEALPAGLQELEAREKEKGLRTENRVTMILALTA